jgi:hypothetical protein
MNAKSNRLAAPLLALTSLAWLGIAGGAYADSISGTIDMEWVIAGPIFQTLSLPAAQSIDSIEIEIAHTNAHDLVIYLDASAVKGEADFDLMFQETAEPPPGDDFSMGAAIEDGTLANVATYTFVPEGGGGYTAPHTPAGTLNANAWLSGPLAAQKVTLVVGDVNLLFDGGAVGTWTIHFTPARGLPGDADGNGVVDVDDLVAVILSWGPCEACTDCPADFDDNCAVDVDDLIAVILNWG